MIRSDIRYRSRAIILPVVLVMVMLLGMLTLGFGFSTRAEYKAMNAQITLDQAQNAAVSGVEVAALLLRQKFDDPKTWSDNPQLFKDQPVQEETDHQEKKNVWRYSLVGYNLDSQDTIRYGLTDEASKVNINVASEDQLKRLPGVTAEMAAALMDWREQSDKARSGGAKDEYYMSLSQPYRCKNAPLDTVEELLLVKGFTSKEVFGEDMNRNGMLEPNEDDGRKSLPVDNGDGNMDRGLYPYITVYSREPEVTDSDPFQPRINILLWPTEVIRTMLGNKIRSEVIDFIAKVKDDKEAKKKLKFSPAYLLGMELEGKDGASTKSPVTVDDMDEIMDYLTTGYHLNDDGYVYGRINVNTASKTVLSTIGRLSESEIENIVTTRSRLDPQVTKTIAWLVTQNVLSPEKFKEVACLFTARSYQFNIESLGYCDREAIQARIQAVMELRLPRIQYIYWRDLTGLGRAYNISEFGDSKIAVQP